MQSTLALEALQRLGGGRFERVLDVGCGDGRVTATLAGREVVGVDLSPSMVEYARRLERPGLRFQVADAARLDGLRDFDLIVSFACLHWLSDPGQGIAAMARALRRGGRILTQCGARGNMREVFQALRTLLCRRRWSRYFSGFRMPWTFTVPSAYRGYAERADLEVVRVERLVRPFELSAEDFPGWFRAGWRPYAERLPVEHLPVFLNELVEVLGAPVRFQMVRAELEATRTN